MRTNVPAYIRAPGEGVGSGNQSAQAQNFSVNQEIGHSRSGRLLTPVAIHSSVEHRVFGGASLSPSFYHHPIRTNYSQNGVQRSSHIIEKNSSTVLHNESRNEGGQIDGLGSDNQNEMRNYQTQQDFMTLGQNQAISSNITSTIQTGKSSGIYSNKNIDLAPRLVDIKTQKGEDKITTIRREPVQISERRGEPVLISTIDKGTKLISQTEGPK